MRTLVIGLEGVLIHMAKNFGEHYDLKVELRGEGGGEAQIALRPGAVQALRALALDFEIVIWGDGEPAFVDAVVQILDPYNELISLRLYGSDRLTQDGVPPSKPFALFANRALLWHIESSIFPALSHLSLLIPLPKFTGNKGDRYLISLVPWLLTLNNYKDHASHMLLHKVRVLKRLKGEDEEEDSESDYDEFASANLENSD